MPLTYYLLMSFLLFIIGFIGFLTNKKNIISYIISLEIVFLAINLLFISISSKIGNVDSQILTIFILSITTAEIALGLAIIIKHFKICGSLDVSTMLNINEL